MSDAQLKDIIEQFRLAADKRRPESMCQVSPRALLVALAHFESMARERGVTLP